MIGMNILSYLLSIFPQEAKSKNGSVDGPFFFGRNGGNIGAPMTDALNYNYADTTPSHKEWVLSWLEWMKKGVGK